MIDFLQFFKPDISSFLFIFIKIAMTHGSTNSWIPKIETNHQICHNLLVRLFKGSCDDINSFQKDLGRARIDENILSIEHCHELLQFKAIDLKFLKRIEQNRLGSADDYCYNPYMSDDYDFCMMDQTDDLIDSVNQRIEQMHSTLNGIIDFVMFRCL